MKPKTKRLIAKTHSLVALILAIIYVPMAVTGSLLAFKPHVEAAMAPKHMTIADESDIASLQLIASHAAKFAGDTYTPYSIDFGWSGEVKAAYPKLVYLESEEVNPAYPSVYMDPVTASPLGYKKRGFFDVVLDIHTGYIAGRVGELAVGYSGFALIFSIVTGLVLWWPKAGRWKRAFRPMLANKLSTLYSVHGITGALIAPLLLLIAVTGTSLMFFYETRSLVSTVSPLNAPFAPDTLVSMNDGSSPITVDQALAVALSASTEVGRPIYMDLPTTPDGYYRVKLSFPWETNPAGATDYWIDQYSGEIIHKRESKNFNLAERVLASFGPIHHGTIFGLLTQILAFLIGVLFCVLMYLGYSYWHQRPTRGKS